VQRWRGLAEIPSGWGRSVVTIGSYDGVHLGHQRIIRQAVSRARDLALPTVVVTFDPHPKEVVRPGSHPPMLAAPHYRTELMAGLGVDAVLVLPFTLEFSRLTPEEFVKRVLADRLRAAVVVEGADFRFGHRAAGDVRTLAELGARYGFEVEVVELVTAEQETFSSTNVRAHVLAGDVAGAARMLGRPHRVEGVVVRGARRGGSELGYPTANLECLPHSAIPADGVYAGWLVTGGASLPAAISIGTNPTFGGDERSVEAYALDRDDLDLYGTHAAVDFLARLRDMVEFDSVDALIEQMDQDVKRTRELIDGRRG
jgi:riboflavin kinase/FMN adenylyltransferase